MFRLGVCLGRSLGPISGPISGPLGKAGACVWGVCLGRVSGACVWAVCLDNEKPQLVRLGPVSGAGLPLAIGVMKHRSVLIGIQTGLKGVHSNRLVTSEGGGG